MRYLLLIYGCARSEDNLAREDKLEQVRAYTAMLRERGVFRAADPLHAPDTATTVRVRDGEALVTDGPFAEAAEWLGGYFLLDCRDLDEAMEFAARCPMASEGGIEIRPILEFEFE
jgi:hypothetical protein